MRAGRSIVELGYGYIVTVSELEDSLLQTNECYEGIATTIPETADERGLSYVKSNIILLEVALQLVDEIRRNVGRAVAAAGNRDDGPGMHGNLHRQLASIGRADIEFLGLGQMIHCNASIVSITIAQDAG